MSKQKIFTEKEIYELREIVIKNNFPMKLSIDKSRTTIDLDFSGEIFFQSILRKKEEGYWMDYISSRGEDAFQEKKEWIQFKIFVARWIQALKRDHPFVVHKKSNIEKLSPSFYKFYQEAIMIENLGFKESSGMIYRKSLEVIVKDFLFNYLPKDFEKIIRTKTIGGIVLHFYEIKDSDLQPRDSKKLENIQNILEELKSLFKMIRNTFKIGNDFSHYERKLEEYKASDMKENLDKIVEFLNHSIDEKNIQNHKMKLNKEFDSNKLL